MLFTASVEFKRVYLAYIISSGTESRTASHCPCSLSTHVCKHATWLTAIQSGMEQNKMEVPRSEYPSDLPGGQSPNPELLIH